jgi:hypothetical protein
MENNNNIYNKNLLSLSSRNNQLAINLGKSETSNKVSFKESRAGSVIPVIKLSGKERSLHSRIDPIKEGFRFYSNSKANGFIIFLGLGAAYHKTFSGTT